MHITIPIRIPGTQPHHLFLSIRIPETNSITNAIHTKECIEPNEDAIPKKTYKIVPNTTGKNIILFS